MDKATPIRYGGAFRRLLANIIDSLVVSIIQFIAGLAIGFMLIFLSPNLPENNPIKIVGQLVAALIYFVVTVGYPVYFIGTRGQTPGKMAMGIKIVGIDSGQHPSFVNAFLREVIGKFLSGIFLGLGFLWIIWDEKKQGWHDKIARTIVIKV